MLHSRAFFSHQFTPEIFTDCSEDDIAAVCAMLEAMYATDCHRTSKPLATLHDWLEAQGPSIGRRYSRTFIVSMLDQTSRPGQTDALMVEVGIPGGTPVVAVAIRAVIFDGTAHDHEPPGEALHLHGVVSH